MQTRRQRTVTITTASSVLAPGTALRSVPTVALSSAQATSQHSVALASQRSRQRRSVSPALDMSVMGVRFGLQLEGVCGWAGAKTFSAQPVGRN